jgi:hypothetical protein
MVQANGLRYDEIEKTCQGGAMIRWLVAAIGFCIAATPVLAADPIEIGIGYLGRAGVKPKLSLVELPAENDGLAGARLAIEDNNTTGKFLSQHFTLEEVSKTMRTSQRPQQRLQSAAASSLPTFRRTIC